MFWHETKEGLPTREIDHFVGAWRESNLLLRSPEWNDKTMTPNGEIDGTSPTRCDGDQQQILSRYVNYGVCQQIILEQLSIMNNQNLIEGGSMRVPLVVELVGTRRIASQARVLSHSKKFFNSEPAMHHSIGHQRR